MQNTKSSNTRFAIILITSLFFLWGFALNLNPILIPHSKKACQLTDTQSAFIDSASYFAYFLLAFPAGKFMERFGYKGGIIVGLLLLNNMTLQNLLGEIEIRKLSEPSIKIARNLTREFGFNIR